MKPDWAEERQHASTRDMIEIQVLYDTRVCKYIAYGFSMKPMGNSFSFLENGVCIETKYYQQIPFISRPEYLIIHQHAYCTTEH